MIFSSVVDILNQTWPTIVICTVILVSLRLGYVIKNKVKVKLYKELFTLCFVMYFMCLFYIVSFQDVSWSGTNIIPFKEIFRYEFGTKLFIKNVLGNLLLFMPYGVAVGYYIKTKKIRHAFILGLLLSCSIEITQYLIGRVFDVDDILLNVTGCIMGFLIYKLVYKFREELPPIFKKEKFCNIVMIVTIAAIIAYLIFIFRVIT